MTDTIESLRARLAEAEGALREAMTKIPSQWGPSDVLAHLLRRAGERDQAVVRAEAAEAALEIVRLEKGWQAAADRAKEAERERDAARAEADVRSGRWCEKNRAEGRDGCGMCAWCCKWQRERADTALAACAEMRAALTEIIARGQEQRGTGRMIETAEAALARTDLGAGWASPEVVAQMVGALQMVEGDGEFDSLHEVTRKFVVDVLALIKKGGW